MDIAIAFLQNHLTVFYIIGIMLLCLKIIVVIGYKGFNFTQIVFSFINFYNEDRIETERRMSKSRAFFMSCNNFLNLLFYIWAFVIIIYFVVTSNLNQF
ncbi:MAG: hypothetical protein C0459_08760 [Chitinophaga sp.]|nr:hypothetical protein [Chitinophaga sp.]